MERDHSERSMKRRPKYLAEHEIALQVITEVRCHHPEYAFKRPKQSTRVYDMNTTSWQNARKKLNLPVRIHDLKHTFGRRLRAADVSEENRRDLLGHKSHRITMHYSAAEIRNLIDAANKACVRQTSTPTLGRMKAEAASLTLAE